MSEEAQAVESNDTLIPSEPASLVDAGTPELGEGEYFLSDGIKGTGELPEWYKADKYKSVAEQAKAYTELEKKFGGFTGAPKDGYELAEGYESDEITEAVVEFGQKYNMSQAAFQEALELVESMGIASEEVSREMEIEALGDNANQRIKQAETFLKNAFAHDADGYEHARTLVTSAKDIELIETIVKATAPAKLPIDGHHQPGGVTWEDIEAEMFKTNEHGHLLRSVSPEHEKKIQRMMHEYGGDRQNHHIIGP